MTAFEEFCVLYENVFFHEVRETERQMLIQTSYNFWGGSRSNFTYFTRKMPEYTLI